MDSERRKTPRLFLQLTLDVSSSDDKGMRFHETVKLTNISGGGAQFTTASADFYFVGQQLQALVHIPGTKEVSGNMSAVATVLRIGNQSTNRAPLPTDRKKISIRFLRPLALQRT